MINTVSSTTPSYSYPSNGGLGGLQSQLAQYQKKLSECVNCSSYDTPAGKRDAQQLNDQIAQIQARIEQIQQRQAENKTTHQTTETNPAPSANNYGSSEQNPSQNSRLGGIIDVYV